MLNFRCITLSGIAVRHSVYPSCSTLTFEFFMREAFDGPGEDGLMVMRADRGVEIGSSLYSMLGTPYALAMMLIYPTG